MARYAVRVTRSALLTLLLLGCGNGAASPSAGPSPVEAFLLDPELALPQRISELGVYRPGTLELAGAAHAFEPGYPLWSDGGEKQRALWLPPGERIDASVPDGYQPPVGSLLLKTFSFRTLASPTQPVAVETRVLRRLESGWDYAAYAWDEDGEDAELLDLRRPEPRPVLDDEGEVFDHSIPSRLECRQCHESSESPLLGLNELSLAASGSLDELSGVLGPPPAAPYASLAEHGPLTREVLGYFWGNCVHCHNGSNGAASSFDLRPGVALDNIVDHPTESSATADGVRVRPGDPDGSVLFMGLRGGDREVKDMPPLGVARRDERALELVRDFIIALAETRDP